MTLIETAIALVILFVATGGLLGLGAIATVTTENQGHLAARTAEYAQDKMEQLMSLKYGDTTSDTITVTSTKNCVQYLTNPACSAGGKGLDPNPGGSLDFAAPVDDYVDYLDVDGNPLGGGTAAPADWYYMRIWRIDQSPGGIANLKQITVRCMARFSAGTRSTNIIPITTLTTYKSDPF